MPEGKKSCPRQTIWLVALILGMYVLDQCTKWWTVFHFPVVEHQGRFFMTTEPWTIIPGYFEWLRVHNTGVAWGMGNGTSWAPYVFLCIPVLALIAIGYFWRKGSFQTLPMKIAGSLLAAGILGNLTDRLVQGFFLPGAQNFEFWQNLARGYVVDFISVKIPIIDYLWPVFNVADSCVCIAAVIFFVTGIFKKDAKAQNLEGKD